MEAWPAMMDVNYFSQTYSEARSRFLEAAARRGPSVERYVNPVGGPEGVELTTDVVWLGPDDASRVLVLVSGTHGVEGYTGSAAQLLALESELPTANDTAVLLVHAINPYGFAFNRRTTEGNIDLNRNGIVFADGLLENAAYAALREAFSPREPLGQPNAESVAALAAYEAEHGEEGVRRARSSGQHVDPNGIHYGGLEPTWSHRTILEICTRYRLNSRKWVSVIDFHTGLGPSGYGEPISGCRPSEPGRDLMRKWYGPSMTEPLLGTSTSVVIPGLTQYIWGRAIGVERFSFIALEFGTIPVKPMAAIMAAENWLFAYGDPWDGSAETQDIRTQFREAYDPQHTVWREMVLWRSAQVIAQTLRGLAAV